MMVATILICLTFKSKLMTAALQYLRIYILLHSTRDSVYYALKSVYCIPATLPQDDSEDVASYHQAFSRGEQCICRSG